MEQLPKVRMPKRAGAVDREIGRQIRKWRLAQNIEAAELADRLGVTYQQLRKYEKGLTRLAASRLYDIAEALDVPVHWFLGKPNSTSDEPATLLTGKQAVAKNVPRHPISGFDRRTQQP